MATTTKGFPYPSGSDDVDVPGDIQALANAVDAAPGIQSYTATQIAALSSGAKWAGRVIWNSTTSKLQVCDGSTFTDVDTFVALSTSTPSPLGTAAAGSSTSASKADHVHVMPSPADVGAIATTALTNTAPAALASTAAAGTSVDVARRDHVHAFPTAANVGAIATSLPTTKGDLIVRDSSAPARLGVGSNNALLTADSAQTLGVKWSNVLTNVVMIATEERCNVVASAATGTINLDALTASVWYYTSNASANHTLNIRGNSSTTLSSLIAVGDSITVAWMVTNGATPYYPNVIQVDGSNVTPKWQGGNAPSSGNASSIDVYTVTILKTAATPTYTVLAAQTKFA